MVKNLVIVESPAKAKTIEKFLGKDFLVKSSFGHIRDLAKKNLGVDIENKFAPQYEISSDKRKVVSELRKLSKEAETVWLASDEDREGEAIAWHLFETLKLKEARTKRIVFHEITKNAILNAIENPRQIDKNLVDAQQARRVLDRLVGFEVSPVLWRKVKPSLSAGRVQSVAVRLIVEREREILGFESQSSFKLSAVFKTSENETLNAELTERIQEEAATKAFLEHCQSADFVINQVEVKPGKKTPSPPFTTSTLQQEASRKLGLAVSQTMSIAQKLYEGGFITYMRTDSVNLSQTAIDAAKQEIVKRYGEKYVCLRNYKTKAKGAQEAHEAIRPSYMEKTMVSSDLKTQQLYELIWKRTITSQMSNAELEKTTARIAVSDSDKTFVANGEVLKFDGFLKVYRESFDEDKEPETSKSTILPPLSKNQPLFADYIDAVEKFTHHPPRYTEASLVKKLEELGIGRPSTYAPTISTVQQRGYVLKESREGKIREYRFFRMKENAIEAKKKKETAGSEKNKLFPTDVAMVVTDFLVENFKNIVNYNFTATAEKDFDEIASGKQVWNEMIDRFYNPFHENVEKSLQLKNKSQGERHLGKDPETGKPVIVKIGRFGPMVQLGEANKEETGDKPKFASLKKEQFLETISLEEALALLKSSNQGRYLGDDPKTGKKISARIGRFGPMVQLGEADDSPKYASLKKHQTVETITLAEALDLFKLPRIVGQYKEKDVVAAIGRFGPYLKYGDLFVSIKKGDTPEEIEIDRAIELIEAKIEAEKKKIIKLFDENKNIKIIKDRWGNPCIYYKRKYHRLSKMVKPEELTLEDCLKMVDAEPKTKKTKTSTRKKTNTTKKKTSKK